MTFAERQAARLAAATPEAGQEAEAPVTLRWTLQKKLLQLTLIQ
jgi:hypothetical protein